MFLPVPVTMANTHMQSDCTKEPHVDGPRADSNELNTFYYLQKTSSYLQYKLQGIYQNQVTWSIQGKLRLSV